MNEEISKAMDALAGGATAAATQTDTTDWKAKYEEAQRELNSARVEQGRVKKLNEEKQELERQLAEARSARSVQSAIEALPADLREQTPEDMQKLSAMMAQRAADAAVREAESRRQAEIEALRRDIAARDARETKAAQANFAARIEQQFPGFLSSAVSEGGDKHAAWVDYQRRNAATINEAAKTYNFDILAYHIGMFYRNELGVEPPSGGLQISAADPTASGGGMSVSAKSGKIYTWDEIDALYDQIEVLRSRGDKDGMKRLSDEIEKAQREGRVK